MALMPESGTRLYYNGYTFLTYSSKVSATPVLDAAARAVKYVEYTIEAAAYVEPDSGETTTDTALETMRVKLTQCGQNLKYVDKGLGLAGTLDINGPTSKVRDACWGPKPELLDFTPVGDSKAALVHWKVKTWLPCQHTTHKRYQDMLVEFSYNCQHALDENGYSTISYNGRIEIAMTRRGDSLAMPDHVDKYRELVRPLVPLGFQRKSQRFDISDDKRVMTWSIVDEQARDPLPEGVTHFGIKQNINSGIKNGFTRWFGSLSGTIIVPPNYSKTWGVVLFLALLRDRTRQRGFLGVENNQYNWRGYAMITDFQMGNELCGRSVDVSARYWFLAPGSLLNVMAVSGILEPVNDANWVRWRQSLDPDTWHVRGPNRVGWNESDDRIVDLCLSAPRPRLPDEPQTAPPPVAGRDRTAKIPFHGNVDPAPPVTGRDRRAKIPFHQNIDPRFPPPPPPPPRTTPPPPGSPPFDIPSKFTVPKKPGPSLTPPEQRPPDLLEGIDPNPSPPTREGLAPDPRQSWVDYAITLEYREEKPRWAEHKPLENEPARLLEGVAPDVTAGHAEVSARTEGGGGSARERKPDRRSEFQEVGTPTAKIYLKGSATRINYKIPLPGELRVGGQKTKLARVVYNAETVVARAGGLPVWHKEFVLEYLLEAPCRELPTPANPALQVDGRESAA